MRLRICVLLLVLFVRCGSSGQVLTTRPAPSAESHPTPTVVQPLNVLLAVPAGTPLKIALDKEIRVRKVGQPIHGKVVEPVYSFDKLVVPAGSEVIGKVSAIEPVAAKKRILAAMNQNLSPPHQVELQFDELRLADGRSIPLQTKVSSSNAGVLQFVTVNDHEAAASKAGAPRRAVSRKVSEMRQEIKKDLETARQELHTPGKIHRLERLGIAQLPYHPQYIDSGAAFDAQLLQPLDFGHEDVAPEALTTVGSTPPSGSVLHARLTTPLSSASAKKDDAVEAVISQPLIVSDKLIFPAGSRLKGAVLQARPAGRLMHNGQLRITFRKIELPDGVEQKVEASLEGVAIAKDEHLSLDSEGGARATSPPSRYLMTGLQIALAASSVGGGDHDHDSVDHGGDPGAGAANGASGFRLVGTLVGAFAHSRVVSSGLGFYGAAMSVYSHFLARGHDVVYPKDMTMVIGLGTREAAKGN